MKTIVQFQISKGEDMYIAECISLPIFTQADTLDELVKNIKEAADLYFEDETVEDLGYSRVPSLLVNFELPQYV